VIRRRQEPIGVVLAGGLGRRMGGPKATVELCGRPLITYPLAAMVAALKDVVIVAKLDSELPSLPGVKVWIEPDEPRHPLLGVAHALALADERRVVACPGDLPFVSAELVRSLTHCEPRGALAVIAATGGKPQPLLGCYQPGAQSSLVQAATAQQPVPEAVMALEPRLLEVVDQDELFDVNAPDDLLMAAAMLDRRRAPNRR
jgi:molybdopterin-guanine dinucleotide biosynthesis protein A